MIMIERPRSGARQDAPQPVHRQVVDEGRGPWWLNRFGFGYEESLRNATCRGDRKGRPWTRCDGWFGATCRSPLHPCVPASLCGSTTLIRLQHVAAAAHGLEGSGGEAGVGFDLAAQGASSARRPCGCRRRDRPARRRPGRGGPAGPGPSRESAWPGAGGRARPAARPSPPVRADLLAAAGGGVRRSRSKLKAPKRSSRWLVGASGGTRPQDGADAQEPARAARTAWPDSRRRRSRGPAMRSSGSPMAVSSRMGTPVLLPQRPALSSRAAFAGHHDVEHEGGRRPKAVELAAGRRRRRSPRVTRGSPAR